MPEAPLDDAGSGLAPSGEGWFVVNVRDAEWFRSGDVGSACRFGRPPAWFPRLGVNTRVLTEHVIVGAGEGPCVVLMCGARSPDRGDRFPWA